ncbi:MAG: mandelate racemase/muconate lactonizing enzyme family protein [Pirellulales bacterium]|nr:mandelate racemase/muconate lactonizing enzyme family protein [Pirellulales bacterium]
MSGRIEEIEAFRVRVPLPRAVRVGKMVITQRDYVVVKILDEDGRVGWSYGTGRNAPIAETIEQTIKPIWHGQRLDDYEAIYELAVGSNVCLGTNGIFWRALSLCDCALHDLLARRANTSLAVFLGGTLHQVPCMLVGGYSYVNDSPADFAEQIRAMAAESPAGIKIASTTDYRRDTERLRTARENAGDIPLMLDLYWSADPVEPLIEEAKNWRDLGIGWLEDPVPFDYYEEAAKLAASTRLPIAIGDEQSGRRQFDRLMREAGISVVRLDATVCGGVRAFLDIARAAAERGLEVSCHIFSHLHLQLACVATNVRCVEQFPISFGLEPVHELWRSNPLATDGFLRPDRFAPCGTGYEWDEAAIARYRLEKA